MAYGIRCTKRGFLRSHEIARMIVDRHGDTPETMRHLAAIEEIEARGIRYSNQDFDVLSSALSYLDKPCETPFQRHERTCEGHVTRSSPNGVDVIDECDCGARFLHNPAIGYPVTLY